MVEFFTDNFITVYFIYGLSFFCMGLGILLEVGHASEFDFGRALILLAGFGLVHGVHEWFEMFLLIYNKSTVDPANTWIFPVRLAFLALSFLLLVAFGARMIAGPGKRNRFVALFSAMSLVWALGFTFVLNSQDTLIYRQIAADVYTRYSLGIPGAALTVWGLILQRRRFFQAEMRSFGLDVSLAALAFGLYGGIGQLFASPSTIFPSYYLNAEVFVRWFGFPVQVFRALMAAFSALFIIRSMRAFEVENNLRLKVMQDAQEAARRRLEDLRAELLHRTVKAQEAERQRIALELHDETGQTLTAIGMGLHALKDSIQTNPERAAQQAARLEQLASGGVGELQRMVSGLHPPQLDDFGLMAALRWFARDTSDRYHIPIQVYAEGQIPTLDIEVRTVLYRIAQEAITNVIRHADASQIDVHLEGRLRHLVLRITDNGIGFDIDAALAHKPGTPSWGLMGMFERAELVGAECKITSVQGKGTSVEVIFPLKPGD